MQTRHHGEDGTNHQGNLAEVVLPHQAKQNRRDQGDAGQAEMFSITYRESNPCSALTFEDVDGEENGGSFRTKEVSFPGTGHLDVTLEPAQ